jgi:uncharacterized protein (TIGR03435 family)
MTNRYTTQQSFARISRLSVLLAASLVVYAHAAFAQEEEIQQMAKDAHPSFEVATVKLSDPADQSSGFHTTGHRLFYENESMQDLISFAYGVHGKQIAGAPDWFSKDRYDIKGMPDVAGEPGQKQQKEMLQKLLAERFDLKLHTDSRILSIFTITVAKGGSRLQPSKSDPDGLPDQTGSNNGSQQSRRFNNNSMADFAQMMQYFVDRPVIDLTGLPGKYDFKMEWSNSETPGNDPKQLSDLLTAMPEQLGLKMEAAKGPAKVLVIDHVDRPSAN